MLCLLKAAFPCFSRYTIILADTIYTSFKVKKSNINELKESEIIIWTTTAWTIPANKALAYNESLEYLLVEVNDDGDFKNKKIVIADALIDSVVKDTKIQSFTFN